MKRIIAALVLGCSVSLASHASTETVFENSAGSPLVSLLSSAKKSIDIEIYEMDDPQVLSAIQSAVNTRRVSVRIVKEGSPVGAACRVFASPTAKDDASCTTQKALVIAVQNGGGQYVEFNHANLCAIAGSHCYQHGKITIVDGIESIISTGNFNSTNLCNKAEHPSTCDRDYSVLSTDPAVASTLTQVFENDLKGDAYDVSSVLSQAPTQKLTVSPLSLSPLIAFIHTAKTKIQVQNQYLEDDDLNNALMAAAQNGIEVEVMTASACSFGKPSASAKTKWSSIYSAFDTAGVKSRIFTRDIQINGVDGYLHAKAIVIDGTSAWVGSVNGSATSLNNNREYGIFLTDQTEVQKLQQFMDADFNNSGAETWQDSMSCKNDPAPGPVQGFRP
jgi:phosphatidylserine/phosphatidylglycerophosphate/cardiolipin synthase-like enzyme